MRSFDSLSTIVCASLATIIAVSVLVGCSGARQGQAGSAMTVNQALQEIRNEGMRVSPIRSISPGAARDGVFAETEYGDNIRILEFPNASSASMEISRKSSSAGSAPFFYRSGNIMVVHLDNDNRVGRALEAAFGEMEN